MTKRMLVDATHPEETRVAIVDGNWLSDFDFERASKKQLKGNIYLAEGHPHRTVFTGGVRGIWRQPPWLPALLGNPSRFISASPMADRPPGEEAPEDDAEGYDPGEKHVDTSAYEAEEQELTDESATDHDHHDHDHDHEHHVHDSVAEMMPEAASLDLPQGKPNHG